MRLKILGLQGSKSIDLVRVSTAKMNAEDAAAILIKTKLKQEEQIEILTKKKLTEEEAKEILTKAASSAANVGATTTTGALTGATLSLKAAVNGLTAAMAANPILAVATVVGAAISILSIVVNAHNQLSEKLKQKVDEVTSAYKTQSEALENTKNTSRRLCRNYTR